MTNSCVAFACCMSLTCEVSVTDKIHGGVKESRCTTIKLTETFCPVRFRYGEHKICICSSKGHNFTVESKGIQFSLNNNHHPCCDKFISIQSTLSPMNNTTATVTHSRFSAGNTKESFHQRGCGRGREKDDSCKKFHQSKIHTHTKHK